MDHCGKYGHSIGECRQKSYVCYICKEVGHKATVCPNRSRAPTVQYQQNKQQHLQQQPRSYNFTTQQQSFSGHTPQQQSNYTSGEVNLCAQNQHLKPMMKNIIINTRQTGALIDTGSDINILREDVYQKLRNPPELNSTILSLTGIGGTNINTHGSALFAATIDNIDYRFIMHIIGVREASVEVILGKDFLFDKKVIIENGVVHIENNAVNNVFQINVESYNEFTKPVEIQKLIDEYKPNRNYQTEIQTTIILKDDEPVYQHPRRMAITEKAIVEKQINEWLENDIIVPSKSEYASPIVLVKKKDNSHRLCVDYRRLNKKVIRDRIPLPNMEEQLDQLQPAKFFTTLDLENGFFHVPVTPDSRKYTAFSCHVSIYEFKKTPFGLCNSPSSFWRFVTDVFRKFINNGTVIMYMDDIIIPSLTYNEGLEQLKQVLRTAENCGLNIKWKKCQFLQKQVEYLGFIITEGKISMTENKLVAVSKFPTPKNEKHVQSFLGLTGHFRKFIANYAKIAAPLSDLLKNNKKFYFGENEQAAFRTLKKCLESPPVLHLFDPKLHTELHTDASIEGYGAILLQLSEADQKLHPTYYFSLKTKPEERRYSSFELEVLAIFKSLIKFRVYLLGKPFKIVTDCKAFVQTMSKRDITPRIARWALKLEEFEYTVEHRKGNQMSHVDALSRYPVSVYSITAEVRQAQDSDKNIQQLKQQCSSETITDYTVSNGILYRQQQGRNLIVLPEKLADNVIRKCHEDNGHFGKQKIEQLLKQQYEIENLEEKVRNCINNCLICLIADRKRGKKEGWLHPIPKDDKPLQTFHLDHLGPMTATDKQYKYIFAVIDGFTKFCWLYATKTTGCNEVLNKMEQQQIIFGSPRRIVTDRGAAFTANDFETYCQTNDIDHVLITTGVPRGNGQIERLNSIIISVLTKMSLQEPKKWFKHLPSPSVQMVLNSTYQRAIGVSPFEVLVCVKMHRKEDPQLIEMLNEEQIEHFDSGREEIRKNAKKQISKIQEENRTQHNKKCKPAHKYSLGDLVVIRRTQFGTGMKIKPNFLGPYRVIKVKPNDRYDVERQGDTEGSKFTSTSADNMKIWLPFGPNELQDGRVWDSE